MRIAAAYIRVSTDMQTEFSPDSQLRLIRDYAKSHTLIVPEEFIFMELGVSGKSADKRPEFQKMIATAKGKQFDVILIYHTNRFARNHEESIVYKSMLKRDCDIDVISITQPPIDRKTDMLTNAIYSVMDEWYSIDLAANVKRGMTEKAMRGGYQCSPPYGYKIPGYKQPPIIVEDEAKVVRIIFDMYLNGQTSLWNLGKSITEMGYRTRRGNPWQRRAIEYIITNPAYKGMTVWNKRNNNAQFNSPEDWIVTQGTHEPIISPEDFDKVQEIYYANKAPRRSKPVGTYKHWLSGVLKCVDCGSSMSYSNNKYSSFSCNKYKKGICPTSNSLSQKKAERAVFNIIDKVIQKVYPIPLSQVRVPVHDNAAEIEKLKSRITNIDKKLDRVRDAYSAGYDTLEEYGANKKALLEEKESVEQKIAALEIVELDESVIESIIQRASDVYEKLYDDGLSIEEKSVLLRSLISEIIYDKANTTYQVFFNA
ncbi:MAG: recombinase family protein [Clostridiales bacterium]|nr:recombinase family protein [Clostridiales bacterium]MDR2712841.1 recombinase family protein [Clostridiales bacterium]